MYMSSLFFHIMSVFSVIKLLKICMQIFWPLYQTVFEVDQNEPCIKKMQCAIISTGVICFYGYIKLKYQNTEQKANYVQKSLLNRAQVQTGIS